MTATNSWWKFPYLQDRSLYLYSTQFISYILIVSAPQAVGAFN